MSWGIDLWDQYETLALHTHRGIDFLEKYGSFIRDRCSIELEYASKLRKLAKMHNLKKKGDDDLQFTWERAFVAVMNEVNDLAGQHELIAENLSTRVVKEITAQTKDLKEQKRKYLQDASREQSTLHTSLTQLDKSKKSYEKAFKEAERAQEAYQKADVDLNLSRADLEKAKNLSASKTQQSEDCRNEYANQLQKTNDLQNQHYTRLMPDIFQGLQSMDERRISSTRDFIKVTSEVERDVLPIIQQCMEGIARAGEGICPEEDSKLVIERYKSGFLPPEDIPFIDLSAAKNGGEPPPQLDINLLKPEVLTLKGTLSGGKTRKRHGLFGIFNASKPNGVEIKDDYSDLPPQQRKKKLQRKIDSTNQQIQQEILGRDGLLKMRDVYRQNSALGDPLSVEGQLAEVNIKLDKLNKELSKYERYLEEAEGAALRRSGSLTVRTNPRTAQQRNSLSETESLSRSDTDCSVKNNNNNNKNQSVISAADQTKQPDTSENIYDDGTMDALGTCKVIYSFDGNSEGSLAVTEGEELLIVETDQGDGWTRVRRAEDDDGFVPTTYIECFLYADSG